MSLSGGVEDEEEEDEEEGEGAEEENVEGESKFSPKRRRWQCSVIPLYFQLLGRPL